MKKLALVVLVVLVCAPAALAQTPIPNPALVEFTPSEDHAVIDGYMIGYFTPGASAPVYETSLGKPVPDGANLCTAPITVKPIGFGSGYTAKVRAVAGDTSSPWSDPSNPFARVPGKPGNPALK